MIEVYAYIRRNGSCPFAEWFRSLNHEAGAKVQTVLERMQDGNFGDHHSVGGGVLERRLNFGPGYRIYYGRDGDRLVILLGGGTKARQSGDINAAHHMWDEYKAVKKEI